MIELIDPCETVTLQIDESVFFTPPTVSQTQFVTYNEIMKQWDNQIVSIEGITEFDPSVCGTLVHEIEDVTSGEPVALTGDPFTTNDLT